MAFDNLGRSDKLLAARQGTSFFAQRLAELTDEQFDGPTLLDGWTRKHLVAHVSYNAEALCRLLDWAATGVETPMYESVEQRGRQITEGAALSAAALRNLFAHTAAGLDGKWRNLPEAAWDAQVRTVQGRLVPASETIWMRSREVWIHAVDLDNGGRFADFPDVVLEQILSDIVGHWRNKGLGGDLVLEVDGAGPVRLGDNGTGGQRAVRGPLAGVVRWAAGRGAVGVSSDGTVPDAPPWF